MPLIRSRYSPGTRYDPKTVPSIHPCGSPIDAPGWIGEERDADGDGPDGGEQLHGDREQRVGGPLDPGSWTDHGMHGGILGRFLLRRCCASVRAATTAGWPVRPGSLDPLRAPLRILDRCRSRNTAASATSRRRRSRRRPRSRRRRPARRRRPSPVRRPAAPGDAAALRLPARDRRRARLVGRPQGPDPRPVDPADGGPRRGPPDRVLRLRGRDPREAVRRRATSSSGTGARGSPRPRPPSRPPRSRTASSSSCSTARSVSGRFTIVRTSRRPGTAPRTAFEDDDGEQWLLIHKRDVDDVAGWDAEDHPRSVKSGRTNDEVKAERARDLGHPRRRRRPPRSTCRRRARRRCRAISSR